MKSKWITLQRWWVWSGGGDEWMRGVCMVGRESGDVSKNGKILPLIFKIFLFLNKVTID